MHFLVQRARNRVMHVSKTSTLFSFAASVTADILAQTSKVYVACKALGGLSQSNGTTQRTDFSPSSWTRLREVTEVCRLSQLQSRYRSVLLPITVIQGVSKRALQL